MNLYVIPKAKLSIIQKHFGNGLLTIPNPVTYQILSTWMTKLQIVVRPSLIYFRHIFLQSIDLQRFLYQTHLPYFRLFVIMTICFPLIVPLHMMRYPMVCAHYINPSPQVLMVFLVIYKLYSVSDFLII